MAAEGAEQGVQGALVNVWKGQWRCRVGGVCLPPFLRSALAPSFCFTALGLGRPSLTLTGHHGTRFEAVCTGTFEASYDIGAGASPTGVPDGALICVCGGEVRGWAGPSGSPHR